MTHSEIMKKYAKEHGLKVIDVKPSKNISPDEIMGIPQPAIKIIQL